jgi:hypothetical protein
VTAASPARRHWFGMLLLAGAAAAAGTDAASAQRSMTRFDAIRDCERTGRLQFTRHNPGFRRFLIDRAKVETDRFGDRVGTQFISAVYHGTAAFEAAQGPRRVRFICLHAGPGRGAAFVYTLSD